MSLKVSLAEIQVASVVNKSRWAGVPDDDVAFAVKADIHPEDVHWLRTQSARLRLLLVVRCPKSGAVGWHGVFPAKRQADGKRKDGTLVKSGESGVGVHPDSGAIFVSDYDMMCLWQRPGPGQPFRKLFASALTPGAEHGAWSPEAMAVVRELNSRLQSKIQHGAQDDYTPRAGKTHPGVQPTTRFAAFCDGRNVYMQGPEACRHFYQSNGLHWPYDAAGKFVG